MQIRAFWWEEAPGASHSWRYIRHQLPEAQPGLTTCCWHCLGSEEGLSACSVWQMMALMWGEVIGLFWAGVSAQCHCCIRVHPPCGGRAHSSALGPSHWQATAVRHRRHGPVPSGAVVSTPGMLVPLSRWVCAAVFWDILDMPNGFFVEGAMKDYKIMAPSEPNFFVYSFLNFYFIKEIIFMSRHAKF